MSLPISNAALISTSAGNLESIEWRRVSITGKFLTTKTVTIINRSQNGTAGYDVLTPFLTTTNQVFMVNRGFMQLSMDVPKFEESQIDLLGYVRKSQTRSGLGPVDFTKATTREFQRFDIPLIASTLELETAPIFLQYITQNPPAQDAWPAAVALPELNEGTHMSYAMQWFFFSLIALVAWVIVIRRKLREISEPSALEQTSV